MITIDEAFECEGNDVVVTTLKGNVFEGRLAEVIFDTDPDEYEEECLSLRVYGGYVELYLSEVDSIRKSE